MNSLNMIKERLGVWWLARTEQERRYLGVGAAVVVLALLYSLFVAPALNGRAKLEKELPQLRQQAAQLQAMAQEAAELAKQVPPQVASMSRESLTASLAARSLTAQNVAMTGDYAKLQLNGVSFANLITWLDAQRRENRIGVQEATFTPQTPTGQVDATLTLRQDSSAAAGR